MVTLMPDNKTRIKQSLQSLSGGDFGHQVTSLLDTLGYKSERILHDRFVTASEFVNEYRANQPTQSEKFFLSEVKSVRVLFQLTDAEIDAKQDKLFDEKIFELGKIKSFVFVAVELAASKYAKGKYALFTREINKRFSMPVVVLFKTSDDLYTISFVHRHKNLRDSTRYVLGPISLIREIKSKEPNRAHIDILEALMMDERLKWIDDHGKRKNFDGLLESWLSALDTEELNKRFYNELFDWFLHAVECIRLPETNAKSTKPEEHILRLITRLLFIWFIKQKGLVSDDLFIECRIRELLKNYDRSGDSYYRAILQNLFFATLNTEIDKRGFSSEENNMSSYHYKGEIRDYKKLQDLFNQTPFINGGLFDCLDSADGSERIDYFVDSEDQRLDYSIPNILFFNSRMGKEKANRSKLGLFDIFNKYYFTVEENIPLEQEVALDPELLGKVFENLLAAYNPETRETARKQTGSYYTPRAVVDYIVDESLIMSLAEKISNKLKPHKRLDEKQIEEFKNKIRSLLNCSDEISDFKLTDKERTNIVYAISEIKIIDPAVGSGAFLMTALHKLTQILSQVDPDNKKWERLQRNIAKKRINAVFEQDDNKLRDNQLHHINNVFEAYRKNFGRKLYLIQNNIYGVDIQPIAVQIARLRFFISLTIEQNATTNSSNNYGIQPLPNLDTKFVAADTLIPLNESTQITLGQTDYRVVELEEALSNNREQYFHASALDMKKKCRDRDTDLRGQLAAELNIVKKKAGYLDKIVQWNPYDQNTSADWFDPKYMFGVSNGFDIVIGNPPYIQLQKDSGKLGKKYNNLGYQTLDQRGDIYQLFFERGCQLCNSFGLLGYITSNSWLKAESGSKTRSFFTNNFVPSQLIEMGKDIFETAIVDSCVFLASKRLNVDLKNFPAIDIEHTNSSFPPDRNLWKQIRISNNLPWSILSRTEQGIMDKIYKGTELKKWNVQINRGVTTGYNEAFVISTKIKNALIKKDPNSRKIIKPILRGKDIRHYYSKNTGKWLIYTRKGINIKKYPAVYNHLQKHYKQLAKKSGSNKWYELQASPSDILDKQFSKEKLLWIELVEKGRFSYDNSKLYGEATTFLLTGNNRNNIKYLCTILNSDLITWFFQHIAVTSGMGVPRWKKVYVEKIPIPIISEQQQQPFIALIDEIIRLKINEPNTNTFNLEDQINELTYDLYGLTKNEIKLIQNYLKC